MKLVDGMEWLGLGAMVLAGIPHGAYDLRLARARWGSHINSTLRIVASYLGIGLAMSMLVLLAPALGLLVFLGVSLYHFTLGEMEGSTLPSALGMATCAIVLPVAFHLERARGYLGYFITESQLAAIAPVLQIAAVILLAATLVFVLKGDRGNKLSRLLCMAGWLLLPPLAGFSVWFIGRHSRQHLSACKRLFERDTNRLPADVLALSALAILLIVPLFLRFDPSNINELFAASIILIAGLTLPHVIVTRGMQPERREINQSAASVRV